MCWGNCSHKCGAKHYRFSKLLQWVTCSCGFRFLSCVKPSIVMFQPTEHFYKWTIFEEEKQMDISNIQ